MKIIINLLIRRIFLIIILLLPGISYAQRELINGNSYLYTSRKSSGFASNEPDCPDFISLGFTLNPQGTLSYIAPDGKTLLKFEGALIVVVPYNSDQHCYDYEWYKGEVYIPDYEKSSNFKEIYVKDIFIYVLEISRLALNNLVTSVRTPVYTTINRKSFENAINLQKVQIGSCTLVQECAFMNSKLLETVIFEKAPYIFDYAFAYCNNIKNVVLQSQTELPVLEGSHVFEDGVYENAILYLPDNLLGECEKNPVWSKFVHRKSIEESKIDFIYPQQ